MKHGEAYLLEKESRYQQAFDILFELFHQMYVNGHSSTSESSDANAMELALTQLIHFNQRCSEKISDSRQRESLWFQLLENVVNLQKLTNDSALNVEQMTRSILKGMMRYVSLMTLMQWIMNDAAGGDRGGQISDVKDMLLKMLDEYNYEATLFETTNNLLNDELNSHLQSVVHCSKRAFASRMKVCARCNQVFTASAEMIIFKCNHSYHKQCALPVRNTLQACIKCSRQLVAENLEHLSAGSNGISGTSSDTAQDVSNNEPFAARLVAAQQESLSHIKTLYNAASGVEIVRSTSKSMQSMRRAANYLVSDTELELSPKWRPHV